MDNDNFVYYKNPDGTIRAGGYEIKNKLLEGGRPAVKNFKIQKGGGIESLAVPAGLFLLQQSIATKSNALEIMEKEPKVIGDELYTSLLSLMNTKKSSKRKTRRVGRKKRQRNTRKR